MKLYETKDLKRRELSGLYHKPFPAGEDPVLQWSCPILQHVSIIVLQTGTGNWLVGLVLFDVHIYKGLQKRNRQD